MKPSAIALLLLQNVASLHYLILRHGETNHNAGGIIQGSSDISRLSDKGITQARDAGAALAQRVADGRLPPVRRVLCSPLARAQQTLALLRDSMPMLPAGTVMPELREVDLYSWEGRAKAELQASSPDAYDAWKSSPMHFNVDGHSPIRELWGRAERVWETIVPSVPPGAVVSDVEAGLDDASAILLVCHSAVGQALLSTACGGDCCDFRRHELPNCGMLEIDWPVGTPTALRWRWRLLDEAFAEGEWRAA